MGHLHLSLAAWSISADLNPDWGAANQTIESISVEDLTDGLADLLVDVPELRGSINSYDTEDPCNLQAMPLVKEQLRKDLLTVREAFEAGDRDDFMLYELGGQRLYISGGMAHGVEPLCPLHGAMKRLQAAPIEKTAAEAVGFELA